MYRVRGVDIQFPIMKRFAQDDITSLVKRSKAQETISIPTSITQQVFAMEAVEPDLVAKDDTGYTCTSKPVCSRCGRFNHSLQQCSANKDIRGEICPPLLKTIKKKTEDDRVRERQAKMELKFMVKKRANPCTKWAIGQCILGFQCAYSHDGPGYDPRSKQLCEHFRSGSCKRDPCLYSHKKSDFPCVFFHRKGGCNKRDCEYSHAKMTEEQTQEMERDQLKFKARAMKKLERNLETIIT